MSLCVASCLVVSIFLKTTFAVRKLKSKDKAFQAGITALQ